MRLFAYFKWLVIVLLLTGLVACRWGDGSNPAAVRSYSGGYLSLTGLPAAASATVIARFDTDNPDRSEFSYRWEVTGGWSIGAGQGTAVVELIAPPISSSATVTLYVNDGAGHAASGSVPLSLVGDGDPVLESLYVSLQPPEDMLPLSVAASDPAQQPLSYEWQSSGVVVGNEANTAWSPPVAGRYLVDVRVDNGSQTVTGKVLLDYAGAASWPFFRGTRQGMGSRTPQVTLGNSGALQWKTPFTVDDCSVGFNFVSSVSQGEDGTLYVGGMRDGRLFALDPDTGGVLWSFAVAGSAIWGTPAVGGAGTIYVATEDTGIVYAINADGSERWQYAAGAGVTGPLAIGGDGTVYAGTDEGATGRLIALNPDGTEKWLSPFDLGGTTRSSVNFGADGSVYARDYAGNLFAIDPADGSERWQIALGPYSGASPVIAADGTVYLGSLPGSATARFYAVNPEGSLKWQSDLGGDLDYGIGATAAVGADGTVYLGTWEGTGSAGAVYAVDPADGSVLWRHPADSTVQASIAVSADGTVYAISKLGTLYALDASTGMEKWTYATQASPAEDSPSSPTIGVDGSVYVYTCDGMLHAVR